MSDRDTDWTTRRMRGNQEKSRFSRQRCSTSTKVRHAIVFHCPSATYLLSGKRRETVSVIFFSDPVPYVYKPRNPRRPRKRRDQHYVLCPSDRRASTPTPAARDLCTPRECFNSMSGDPDMTFQRRFEAKAPLYARRTERTQSIDYETRRDGHVATPLTAG